MRSGNVSFRPVDGLHRMRSETNSYFARKNGVQTWVMARPILITRRSTEAGS